MNDFKIVVAVLKRINSLVHKLAGSIVHMAFDSEKFMQKYICWPLKLPQDILYFVSLKCPQK